MKTLTAMTFLTLLSNPYTMYRGRDVLLHDFVENFADSCKSIPQHIIVQYDGTLLTQNINLSSGVRSATSTLRLNFSSRPQKTLKMVKFAIIANAYLQRKL